jgi:hypothetical protein
VLSLFSPAVCIQAEAPPPEAVVKQWTKLYGRDTVAAGRLTTDSFRGGNSSQAWGEKTQTFLKSFGYQHLGGKILSAQVSGAKASIILRALIASGDGLSWKRETYTLKRVGSQWLIDAIDVKEDVKDESQ